MRVLVSTAALKRALYSVRPFPHECIDCPMHALPFTRPRLNGTCSNMLFQCLPVAWRCTLRSSSRKIQPESEKFDRRTSALPRWHAHGQSPRLASGVTAHARFDAISLVREGRLGCPAGRKRAVPDSGHHKARSGSAGRFRSRQSPSRRATVPDHAQPVPAQTPGGAETDGIGILHRTRHGRQAAAD